MSYEPTVWKDGDLVTSAKLNKLEQGVATAGSGILIVHMIDDGETSTLDKTWQEIHDADACYVIGRYDEQSAARYSVIRTGIFNGKYGIQIYDPSVSYGMVYPANSPSDYPTIYYGSNDSGNTPTPT